MCHTLKRDISKQAEEYMTLKQSLTCSTFTKKINRVMTLIKIGIVMVLTSLYQVFGLINQNFPLYDRFI